MSPPGGTLQMSGEMKIGVKWEERRTLIKAITNFTTFLFFYFYEIEKKNLHLCLNSLGSL